MNVKNLSTICWHFYLETLIYAGSGERLKDVAFWKDQLTNEISAMNLETENLLDCKARLEKALFDTQRPLAISEECMLQRERRTGIDQTFDEPEKGLCKVSRR